jgi:hypothetical protein
VHPAAPCEHGDGRAENYEPSGEDFVKRCRQTKTIGRSSYYCEAKMTMKGIHKHTKITTLALAQRRGVPYEVQRTVCSTCRRLFDEKPVRRAAA